jgi:dTDP-D-glucose 4,6-dehydratase
MIKRELGWAPNYPLERGMRLTYAWVESQVRATVK